MIKTFTKAFLGTAICAMSLSATAAVIPAASVIEMDTPAQTLVTKSSCYGAMLGQPFGMAAISLNCAKKVAPDVESPLLVSLYYGDKLVKSIGTTVDEKNGCGVINGSIGAADDFDPSEWGTGNIWVLMFNVQAPEEYWQYGEYRVEIPEGFFILGDDVVGAMTLKYQFTDEAEEILGYTFTPEAGTEFTVTNPIKSVTLTVTGTQKMIMDYADSPAKWSGLYNPAGEKLILADFFPGLDGQSITWNIKENPNYPIEWVDGVYTFRVLKEKIYVGRGAAFGDYDEDPGNFPTEDIEVGYVIKDGNTAVTMLGTGASESYTIYTLDGVKVLDSGSADELLLVPAGVYIINGKQTVLRK